MAFIASSRRGSLLAVIMAALALLPVAQALPQSELQARHIATQWLAGVDAGRYAEAWEQAAPEFRRSIPLAEWLEQIRKVRPQLGKVEQRTLKRLFFAHQLPEAPLANYVVIEFETRFAGSDGALREIVTPVLVGADGRLLAPQSMEEIPAGAAWQVCGYYILPPQPVLLPAAERADGSGQSAASGQPAASGQSTTSGQFAPSGNFAPALPQTTQPEPLPTVEFDVVTGGTGGDAFVFPRLTMPDLGMPATNVAAPVPDSAAPATE